MKIKVGTVMDEDMVFKVKEAALTQRKTLSQILEDALKVYLQGLEKKEKKKNLAQDTSGIMKISKKDLKAVMEEKGLYEA
ncbi:MAG: hypothetical protein HZB80_07820 [Deltaproteobacteria bacterium]|nr:hypothetical protein [Deltaproteobacteria bacterium]